MSISFHSSNRFVFSLQDAVDTKPIPVSVVCHLRTAGDDTVAVLALKTAEPGAQSRLIITGTNCGGTAEAERNVRPQLFTLIHTHLISFCRLLRRISPTLLWPHMMEILIRNVERCG